MGVLELELEVEVEACCMAFCSLSCSWCLTMYDLTSSPVRRAAIPRIALSTYDGMVCNRPRRVAPIGPTRAARRCARSRRTRWPSTAPSTPARPPSSATRSGRSGSTPRRLRCSAGCARPTPTARCARSSWPRPPRATPASRGPRGSSPPSTASGRRSCAARARRPSRWTRCSPTRRRTGARGAASPRWCPRPRRPNSCWAPRSSSTRPRPA